MFRSKGWFFHTSPVVCKLCSLEPCRDCVGLRVLGSTQEAVLSSQTILARLSGNCQPFRSGFFGSFPPGKHFPVGRTFKTSQGCLSVILKVGGVCVCVYARSCQSCLTLCHLMDCSPPGFSVRGILQARILEWVARPSSRGSSQSRD